MSINQENHTLRARGAAQYLGVGTSTFWRWYKEGRLPKGILLSPRCRIWRREDLDAYLEKAFAEALPDLEKLRT